MQVILRQLGDCNIRRAGPSDLISVMEINLKTLPEHYSDYFYESLLAELPEAFIIAEIGSLGPALRILQSPNCFRITCMMGYSFINI